MVCTTCAMWSRTRATGLWWPLACFSLSATRGALASFWTAPEVSLPELGRARLVDRSHVLLAPSLAAVDLAFPDINCDRTEGGRWRVLRQALVALVENCSGHSAAAKLMRWPSKVAALERAHGFSRWLHLAAGKDWIIGTEDAAAGIGNRSIPLACPMGVAAVAAASLVGHLVSLHRDPGLRDGRGVVTTGIVAMHAIANAAKVMQAALQRALAGTRFIMSMLAAARWPVLDILVVAEKHLLGDVHKFLLRANGVSDPEPDCLESLPAEVTKMLQVVKRMVEDESVHQHGGVAYRQMYGWSDVLATFATAMKFESDTVVQECIPVALIYHVVCTLACVEQQHTAQSKDPEMCVQGHNKVAELLIWRIPLESALVFMNFAQYPAFAAWRLLRRLMLHRFDLPFTSTADLAAALGLWHHVDRRGRQAEVFQAAHTTFDALGKEPRLAVLTACWGPKHSGRLHLWLEAVQGAGMLHRTVVNRGAVNMCSGESPRQGSIGKPQC